MSVTLLSLPESTQHRLTEFRSQYWRSRLSDALIIAVGPAVCSIIIFFILERFLSLPVWARTTLLLAGLPGLLIGLPAILIQLIQRSIRSDQLARLIRRHHPAIGDQLLGAIELAGSQQSSIGSQRLAEAAIRQVDEAFRARDVSAAIPVPIIRRYPLFCVAPLLAAALLFLVTPAAAWNSLQRWVLPLGDIPRYTFAQLESLPGKLIAARGEPLGFQIAVRDGSPWVPGQAAFRIGTKQAVQSDLVAGRYEFQIPPQTESVPVMFSAGDFYQEVLLEVADRPGLIAVHAEVTLPDYLQQSEVRTLDVRGGTVSIVRGARFTISGETSRELVSAELTDGLPIPGLRDDSEEIRPSDTPPPRRPVVPPKSAEEFTLEPRPEEEEQQSPEQNSADSENGALPPEATAPTVIKEETLTPVTMALDVREQQFRSSLLTASHSRLATIRWTDSLGLSAAEEFRLRLKTTEDAAPEIILHQLEPKAIVLSTEVITFEIQADDDFGLRRCGLQWQTFTEQPTSEPQTFGEKIVAAGDPSRTRLNLTAAFCAETEQIRPQLLKIQAFVEDYLPNRRRSLSAPVIVQVMSPEEHAVWIAEQMRRWNSLADEVYEQEMRLHIANRELRQLTSDELDQPERQRMLKQQAMAERASAELLGRVTDQGEQLIEQAVMNQQMLSEHLEAFAGSLQRLRGISERRMPSVEDLLAKSANAAGGTRNAGGAEATQEDDENLTVGQNRSSPAENAPDSNADSTEDKPATKSAGGPQMTDVESRLRKDPQNAESESEKSEADAADKAAEKVKAARAGLTVPVTTLQGGPQLPSPPEKQPAGAQKSLDEAVEEQAGLLSEFNAVRDELQSISDDLENSTFVKRFKAASRRQQEIAEELNRTLFRTFGRDRQTLDETQRQQMEQISQSEETQSRRVTDIQSDLEAWTRRRSEPRLLRILDEMKSTQIPGELQEIADRVRTNLAGESISRAEYWSDTLDRWGEELVSVPLPGGSADKKKPTPNGSLPPTVVLEIMRLLKSEIDLREETRSAEQSRSAIEEAQYRSLARTCQLQQAELFQRTRDIVTDIRALPEGDDRFSQEIASVELAGMAMLDAVRILSLPDTGADAVAAETEAIEELLRSRRVNPKGKGGGGKGNSPGEGGEGSTERAALEQYGPTSDRLASVRHRQGEQSTGDVTSPWPEEFQGGLDAFFQALENRHQEN
ncbi:MAG: hypothetical protein ACK526_20645 [Planctomyces sp.]